MALITCKDCKKKFSTDAKSCPHCGAKKPRSSLEQAAVVLIGLVAVIAYASSSEKSKDPQEEVRKQAKEKADDEQAARQMHVSYDQYVKTKAQQFDAYTSCKRSVEGSAQWGSESDFFPRYAWSTNGKTIQIVGRDLRMKNGFNAERYVIYTCIHDIASGKTSVVSVQ